MRPNTYKAYTHNIERFSIRVSSKLVVVSLGKDGQLGGRIAGENE